MFLVFVFVSLVFAVAYAAIMSLYWLGWRRLPESRVSETPEPDTRITVIIPARNEAATIGACLDAILSGSYPLDLLDIIVVDDHSEDNTAGVVRLQAEKANRNKEIIRLIHLCDYLQPGEMIRSHKKKALEIAIAQAKGDWMVTTDADCVAEKDWLRYLSPSSGDVCRVAPVLFYREQNLFERFQSLDFLGLMGITGAGIHLGFQRMGNGANLGYSKAVFEELGGLAGSEHIASGDDIFLIQKIARRYPEGLCFVKSRHAVVRTLAKPDWRSFVQQRIRWGTKNAALPEWKVKAILAVVFLFCWCILLSVFVPWLLFMLLAIKALFDFIFLRELSRFFGRRDLLRAFWPAFFLHIVYIAGVGLWSIRGGTYEWKGRRLK